MAGPAILLHQLSGGGTTDPAIYIAEVRGLTNAQLQHASIMIRDYQQQQEFQNGSVCGAIYSFVKHDTRSVKNCIISTDSGALETLDGSAHKYVKQALKTPAMLSFNFTAEGKCLGVFDPGLPFDTIRLSQCYE